MAKNRLTDRKLKALKPKGKRYDVMDAEVSGWCAGFRDGPESLHPGRALPGSPNPTAPGPGGYPTTAFRKPAQRQGNGAT